MPEFILDSAGTVNDEAFDELPAFVQGYIECLFFTETSYLSMTEWHTEESQELVREGQADGNIPADAGFSDLHPDALLQIKADCGAFHAKARDLLKEAYGLTPGYINFRHAKQPIGARRAGQLFWYARNGHGICWTDDGQADCLRKLQEVSRGFGEVNTWFSETEEPDSPTGYGWVYLD